ncbi:MAG: SMP-30/gluconolactonase/LRE family protein [Pseudomonadales bacterium]|jgi:arylesterase/paraoxonase|nr:SMP-30/gluconolactonase/LRE family protein [Pseudomonadales bacterium]
MSEYGAGRLRTFALLALLALALGFLIQGFRARMGVDRAVARFGTEACTVVPAPAGPEDLEVDTATDTLFVSALDRRLPGAEGDLWSWALAAPDAELVRVARDGPARFRPHGLSLVRSDAGLFVWVVNHPGERHTVEGFVLEAGADGWRARHLVTVAGAALVSPNDVAAVDAGRFYVSNDHGTSGGLARTMEDLLGLDLANVLYFDGERFEEVIEGLSYANGVALARGGAELVVAEVFRRGVTFHDREPVSGRAQAHLLVDLDSGVDNLTVAADGSIWVAGHPRLLEFADHAGDPSARSATEVIRMRRTEGGAVAERVLMDDGSLLSGGSVAAPWRDEVVIGAVFQSRLLRCGLAPEFSVD